MKNLQIIIEGKLEVISTDTAYYKETTKELLAAFQKKGFNNQSIVSDIISLVMNGYWEVMRTELEVMKIVKVVEYDKRVIELWRVFSQAYWQLEVLGEVIK